MIDLIIMAVAYAGTLIAGIFDLKTTEIPDWIPFVMILTGLIGNSIKSIMFSTWSYSMSSLITGVVFLAFGFLFYKLGQWGGGDVKILTSLGFMVPGISFDYSMNLLFVSLVYISVYLLIRNGNFSTKREIGVEELKEGDILDESRELNGLSAEDVEQKKILMKGEKVIIKEGVRYAPVFFITLLVTNLVGSLINLMFMW